MSVHQNTNQFNLSRRAALLGAFAAGAAVAAPVQAEQSYMSALYDRWVAVRDEVNTCGLDDSDPDFAPLYDEMIALERESASYPAKTATDVHYQIAIASADEPLSEYDEIMAALVAGARAAIGGAA